MQEQDVVQLLRHYQHDLLNELQIIQGYASMDKTDKVKDKIKACVDIYKEERKLMHLNIPKTTVWFLQTQYKQNNIHVSYDIQVEDSDVSFLDQNLVDMGTYFVKQIQQNGVDLELYTLHIEMHDKVKRPGVEICWNVEGPLEDKESLEKRLKAAFPHTFQGLQAFSNNISSTFFYAMDKG